MTVTVDENLTDMSVNEIEIEDEAETDETPPDPSYEITSFGIDLDVAGLVGRLRSGDIYIPDWQRNFVWTTGDASRFIESLLLGLPVPGIFLGTDSETQQLYVVDGQQRLRTLRGFYDGELPSGDRMRKFALRNVDERFLGAKYDSLDEANRRKLDFSIIHGTVVRQDRPAQDDTSMYQIFERINSGGRKVYPQEIRSAIYHGELIDTIKELNENDAWRAIAGRPSPRLKDQEMILRFMAMYHDGHDYSSPMVEFLNKFAQSNRHPNSEWIRETTELFQHTVESFAEAKGKDAFRGVGGRVVNAAIFDSMSVGFARRAAYETSPNKESTLIAHDSLFEIEDYLNAVTSGTSRERSVATRMKIAEAVFANA